MTVVDVHTNIRVYDKETRFGLLLTAELVTRHTPTSGLSPPPMASLTFSGHLLAFLVLFLTLFCLLVPASSKEDVVVTVSYPSECHGLSEPSRGNSRPDAEPNELLKLMTITHFVSLDI